MPKQIRRLDLAGETLTDLETHYKATSDRRIAERILHIILKAKGHTHEEIADILLVSCDTVSQWLHIYVTEGLDALCQIESGGSLPRLNEAQINELQTELDRRLFSTACGSGRLGSPTLPRDLFGAWHASTPEPLGVYLSQEPSCPDGG